jgi:hypothetical protein
LKAIRVSANKTILSTTRRDSQGLLMQVFEKHRSRSRSRSTGLYQKSRQNCRACVVTCVPFSGHFSFGKDLGAATFLHSIEQGSHNRTTAKPCMHAQSTTSRLSILSSECGYGDFEVLPSANVTGRQKTNSGWVVAVQSCTSMGTSRVYRYASLGIVGGCRSLLLGASCK